MRDPLKDGYDAARLVACGVRPRLRPEADPEYGRLLDRYRVDGVFRRLTDEVASGLGLAILHAGVFGLALGAEEGSVFAYRLGDYRANLTVDLRLLHGLVHLAVAAYCYPTAQSLDEEGSVQRISVHSLERYLSDACERLADSNPQADPPEDQPELEQAWRLWRRRQSARETGDGRRTAQSTTGIISYALETLADQGFLRKVSEVEGDTYQVLARYRVQVRELAAHEGYRMLTAVGAAEVV